MKTIIKISIIFSLAFLLTGANGAVQLNSKPTFTKILVREQLKAYTIPGFLARYVLLFNEDTRKIRPILKGVSSITVSLSDEMKDSHQVFSRINSQLNNSDYTNILEVIDSESCIVIKSLENDNIIRELVLMINDNSSIICISLKGKISTENIFEVLNSLSGNRPNV
jgi:non-homologous end joining protein Ku